MSGTIYAAFIRDYVAARRDLVDTIQEVTTPVNEAYTSGRCLEADDEIQALWSGILEVAQSSGLKQDGELCKLVELVDAIRQLDPPDAPATRNEGDRAADTWPIAEDAELWSDLPGFGAQVREVWNVDVDQLSSSERYCDGWQSLNRFVALLWSRYTVGETSASFDLALFSIWSLRETLEEPQSDDNPSGVVPTAAQWVAIRSSRQRLWAEVRASRQWMPAKGTGAPAKTGLLWDLSGNDRVDGFSIGTWKYWKGSRRFRKWKT